MPDSDLMFRPASELAGMVRAGDVSSRELVEISLARIEELNPQLNAFVEVDDERALAAADEVSSGDERPFAGVPIAIKNNRALKDWRLHKRLRADGRFRRALRPQCGAASEAGGLRDRGHDDAARVRDPAGQRGPDLRPYAQSVGFGANPWRFFGRRCGGGRVRDGAGRARQRRRWLDPDPGGLLRAGGPEARARADFGGPRPGRLLAGD